jgi:hypothetical protein
MGVLFGRLVWGLALLAAVVGTTVTQLGESTKPTRGVTVSPRDGLFSAGDEIPFTITLSSADAVNVVEGVVRLSGTDAVFKSISREGSLITVWVKEPVLDIRKREVVFSGGIPTPGFSGEGVLLKGVVTVKKPGKILISTAGTHVFLNDGHGTRFTVATSSAEYGVFGGGILSPDVSGDGIVDSADIRLLVSAWGRRGSSRYDLNGDGRVDVADLGIILSMMRSQAPSATSSPLGLLHAWRMIANVLPGWMNFGGH